MAYILITIALIGGSSAAPTQMNTQFNSQKACQDAFDYLVKIQSKIVPIGCFAKG
jgi:hypothetical protein